MCLQELDPVRDKTQTGLGASWDRGWCPCPWQGWDEMMFKVPPTQTIP